MGAWRSILAVLLVVTAFAGGTAFMWLAFDGGDAMPRHATVLPEPKSLPEFSLVDDRGRAFGRDSLNGRYSLLFFGFTNCPDICPATLAQLSAARSRVLAQGGGGFPEVILISVDPERDTPAAMADYVARFGDGVTGVTGSREEIGKLAKSLGIYVRQSGSQHGGHDVQHTAAVMLINKSAELQAVFGAPHSIDSFVTDIPLMTGPT